MIDTHKREPHLPDKGKLLCIAHFCHAKGPHPQNFAEKTFANTHKTAKFTKLFSLESFPLYGILCAAVLVIVLASLSTCTTKKWVRLIVCTLCGMPLVKMLHPLTKVSYPGPAQLSITCSTEKLIAWYLFSFEMI